MNLYNNNFRRDTDGEHLERARILGRGIARHGEELGYSEEQISEIAGYADRFESIIEFEKRGAGAENEDLCKAEDTARSDYTACQNYLKGLTTTADPDTLDYLVSRFDIDGEMPERRGDFIKVARHMVRGTRILAEEDAPADLAFDLFENLERNLSELEDLEESISPEAAEKGETRTTKEYLRGQIGEKIFSRVYHRAAALWGPDDDRLVELGFLPEYMEENEPGEPESPEEESK